MTLRNVFTSPPAVAGLSVLAVVIGVALGVRAGMNDGGDRTEVAGAVFERSEPPVATEEPDPSDEPIVIVRPAPPPRQPAPTEDAPAVEQPVAQPQPDPEPTEPVGLVRDEPAAEIEPEPAPRRRRDSNRDPEPPPPSPEPEPTRDPAEQFGMRAGAVDGIHTALAEDGNWLIRQISGHGNQTPEQQASRHARNRMTGVFGDSAFSSDSPQREFRCDVVIDAGSRRLIVDDNHHEFRIQLWTASEDGYSRAQHVETKIVRAELDLAPGKTATLAGVARTLDATEGVNYTCRASFVDLRS